jgi:O-antigen ligase
MRPLFQRVNQINKVLPVLLIFVIPVSTALTNIVLGLLFLCWILVNGSDRFRTWLEFLRSNPVAQMGTAVFCMYLLGMFYTGGENAQVVESLSDGVRFLCIGMMMVYFKEDGIRRAFLAAFMTVMGVILVLSCLLWLDSLPAMIPVKGNSANCVVFHDHIKHNIFMAFAAFYAGLQIRNPGTGVFRKGFWTVFSLAALANVLFMVAGRTGHVIVLILLAYYLLTWSRAKSMAAGILVLLLLGVFAWINPSNPFFSRARTAIEEVKDWQYDQPADLTSSSGLRMEWMVNSLQIIRENPLIGTGTGSFKAVYSRFVAHTQMTVTDNPHNEYLMTAVQFGLAGVLLLLAFFWMQWRHAGSFQDPVQGRAARGLVLLMMTACLTASPLQDSAEGWFFVFMGALFFTERTSTRKFLS